MKTDKADAPESDKPKYGSVDSPPISHTISVLPMMYTIDWYWCIGDDDSKVFSSKDGDLVRSNAKDYKAWCDNYGEASRVASYGDLADMLVRVGLDEKNAGVVKLRELAEKKK